MTEQNLITWDIETVAHPRAAEHIRTKRMTAPKTYKDKEKIEAYVTEARHEAMQKAALKWWTGQIVCVSMRPVRGHWKRKTIVGPNEAALLRTVLDTLIAEKDRPVLIGKNGDTFDRPFFIGRLLALDLGIPDFLRPWRPIDDINQIFGYGSRADQAGRLDEYAFGLNIQSKTGHGTDVQNWFNQAELGDTTCWDKIASYCADDDDITHEMLRRWLKPYPTSPSPMAKGAPRAAPSEPSAPEPLPLDEIPFGSSPSPAVVADAEPQPFDGVFD